MALCEELNSILLAMSIGATKLCSAMLDTGGVASQFVDETEQTTFTMLHHKSLTES